MKRTFWLFMLLLLLLVLCGCGAEVQPGASLVIVPTILALGSSKSARFVAMKGGQAIMAITWKASAGTITATGFFTAPTTSGLVTVTASDGVQSATASVQVVTPLTISPQGMTIAQGQTLQFTTSGGI